MENLNEIIKKSVQSRRIQNPTMIPKIPKKQSCPGCDRRKLISSKIKNVLNKLKEKQ